MMDAMSTREMSVEQSARPWWTLVPFLVAIAAVAGVGGLAAAGS